MRQWEEFERGVVPLDRRVYWFERVDGMPVVSPDLQLRAAAALQTKIIQARQHSRFEIINIFPGHSFLYFGGLGFFTGD